MQAPRLRPAIALGAAVVLFAVLPPTHALATFSPESATLDHVVLAPGVTYTRYFDSFADPGDPMIRNRRAHVIEIDPSSSATIDIMMPTTKLPGTKLLSAMVPQREVPGQTEAVAGINGDFGLDDWPDHAVLNDGVLWQSGFETHANFAIRQNETRAYVDKPKSNVTALAADGMTQLFAVDRWNSGHSVPQDEIVGFSPQGGTTADPPTSNFCSARIKDVRGTLAWTDGKKALLQTYTVAKRKCRGDAILENGETVLSSRKGAGSQQAAIKALQPGQTIRLKFAMGFAGAVDSIGGRPQIVDDGANVAPLECPNPNDQNLCDRDPRAGVGINQACVDGTAGCRVYYVVVDGRNHPWSAGLSLHQFAEFFIDTLGAYDVLNLDGGGSAGMWIMRDKMPGSGAGSVEDEMCQDDDVNIQGDVNTVLGCFVNRPTVNGNEFVERLLKNALVVTDGPDSFPKAEPIPSGP
jgi:phosphodiester glycosidase